MGKIYFVSQDKESNVIISIKRPKYHSKDFSVSQDPIQHADAH